MAHLHDLVSKKTVQMVSWPIDLASSVDLFLRLSDDAEGVAFFF